jgi:hypothetical protein
MDSINKNILRGISLEARELKGDLTRGKVELIKGALAQLIGHKIQLKYIILKRLLIQRLQLASLMAMTPQKSSNRQIS